MSTGLYSGASGLALGRGLYRDVSGLWGGASGLDAGFGGFSPALLFAAGEQGAWYDPSDITTLFQDTAGTTPVTAAGQSVGLMLDKSRGLVLGPELVTNGDFSQGAAGWTLGVGWSVSGGTASFVTTGFAQTITQDTPLVAGRTYLVTYTVISVMVSVFPRMIGTANVDGISRAAPGTYTEYMVAPAGVTSFGIRCNSTSSATITNISVRELPGNHATQANLAQRPIYAREPLTGRRNLLTFSEQFDNAVWSKSAGGTGIAPVVTPNSAIAPDGTMTADQIVFNAGAGTSTSDLSMVIQAATTVTQNYTGSIYLRVPSGTATLVIRNVAVSAYQTIVLTTSWQRFSRTELGSAGTGSRFDFGIRQGLIGIGTINSSATVEAWGAQLELGSTATAYQRVGNNFDVTEAGVPELQYLAFDGSDDGMATGNIVPGTDKAQVFAGVRKLSDAAGAILAETSTNATVNNGSIFLAAPNSAGANYGFASRGTAFVILVPSGLAAPITNVITGLRDIAAPSAIARVNGTQVASSTASQGTGNFLTYPLFIGRRGGASLPFNGRIYGLLVRFGANLSAAQINQTEAFMAAKTGVTL
jgi:hypothetical protein